MKPPTLFQQVLAVISRRTVAFQPEPGRPRTFIGALALLHPHRQVHDEHEPQRPDAIEAPTSEEIDWVHTRRRLVEQQLPPFADEWGTANLADADLTEADLIGMNLSGANFSRANLTGARLKMSFLTGADLTGAVLIGADLTRANLDQADLTEADLTHANLTSANLISAKLSRADLTGADLTGARLSSADFTAANLTQADLTEANMVNARLISADFTDANLTRADLAPLRLPTDLPHDIPLHAWLEGVRWSDRTIWPNRTLAEAVKTSSRRTEDGSYEVVGDHGDRHGLSVPSTSRS